MPKNPDIKKVLVIGSGPIIIGQAAEFDYAGTQACRSLKEEGIEVVLLNSNPATIMTDKDIADKVYIEPLTTEVVEQLIMKEKPDSVLPTLGGQAGLNLAMELEEAGILAKNNVRLIGTTPLTIKKAEECSRRPWKRSMSRWLRPRSWKVWRTVWPWQKRSAIRWCSVRPIPWAAPAAVSQRTRSSALRSWKTACAFPVWDRSWWSGVLPAGRRSSTR